MDREQKAVRLDTFEFENKDQRVSFVETVQVTDGVECDIYRFDGDDSKDLGIIRIKPGFHTPLQRVLKGDRTIEGYLSGKGRLVITGRDKAVKEYPVSESIVKPFAISVSVGEKMQWFADEGSPLIAYEVCFPPYEDGRYENL